MALFLQHIRRDDNLGENSLRLAVTAKVAEKEGFDTIASSLSSSRWKSLDQIDTAGNLAVENYPSLTYLAKNWRKGGLQQRRNELLKENGFYNQLYCGCEFSMRSTEGQRWKAGTNKNVYRLSPSCRPCH